MYGLWSDILRAVVDKYRRIVGNNKRQFERYQEPLGPNRIHLDCARRRAPVCVGGGDVGQGGERGASHGIASHAPSVRPNLHSRKAEVDSIQCN